MTPAEYEKLTPYERALLEELRKFRGAVEEMTKALQKAVEY